MKQKQVMINGIRISYCENIEITSDDSIRKITCFLHGWGSNKESFTTLFPLRKNCIAVDFPAFGKSGKLEKSYTLKNYAEFLADFIQKVIIENTHNIYTKKKLAIEFVVHSFGGRVLLKFLDAQFLQNKRFENILLSNVICIGVPFYRHLTKMQKFQIYLSQFLNRNTYTQSLKKIITPFFSFLFHDKNSDYNALDGEIMKKTFQNIVNEDVSVYVEHLDTCTNNSKNLKLIWGENDDAAPLYYAKNVHKKYPESELFVVANAGHFPWVDNFEAVKKCF